MSSGSSDSSSSFDDEWEEWDGKSPFWHHCVAGSLAGVAEHTLVYPLDTVRTHIQVSCAACHNGSSSGSTGGIGKQTSLLQKAASKASFQTFPHAHSNVHHHTGMWQTMRMLMSQPLAVEGATAAKAATATSTMVPAQKMVGITRLWRGVQTILVGCVPAHALYFSSYEIVKAATLDGKGNVTAYGSALAGAAAVVSHDLILGPLDTVKQRLQLGHYRGLSHALTTMIANEGFVSLYRSFPVTLATNIPYGMVMVGTNEFCKQQWSNSEDGSQSLTMGVTLGASALAGFTAAAMTTPLDRIKTYLQTQQLTPACSISSSMTPPDHCPLGGAKKHSPIVADWRQAALRIYHTEGMVGFFRGMTPRLLSHTPAVAISWTTYETAKQYLQKMEHW
jgi:solute carrier family 25 iron transporter 28/37